MKIVEHYGHAQVQVSQTQKERNSVGGVQEETHHHHSHSGPCIGCKNCTCGKDKNSSGHKHKH